MKENSNGSDTDVGSMENSIKEDIKILENMNDGYTFKDCDICNNYNGKTKHCDKHKCMELQAIEHILSNYKRVLRKNVFLEKMEQKNVYGIVVIVIKNGYFMKERQKIMN